MFESLKATTWECKYFLGFTPNEFAGLAKRLSDRTQPALAAAPFLHGAGERGADLTLVAKHGPPKLVARKKEFPFIIVSPQCPLGQVWDDGHCCRC